MTTLAPARAASQRWRRREALRDKGQFWTPPWVAEAMVAFASGAGEPSPSRLVFDPAFGAGAFARAARRIAERSGVPLDCAGCEPDAAALEQAAAAGVTRADLGRVVRGDFLALDALPPGADVVANPPYIRHHRLSPDRKARLREIAVRRLGGPLDGRTGIHVYFLIHALALLRPGGRLAFIVPADVCEGVFAKALWAWIGRTFRLEAVVTFEPAATPFPGVDTNPVILMVRNATPGDAFRWARVREDGTEDLLRWALEGLPLAATPALHVEQRGLARALSHGVARRTLPEAEPEFVLGDFARVMRGIATGANEFFCHTREGARALGIPDAFLARAIGRTRDVRGERLRAADLDALDAAGRPTFLLVPDGRPLGEFPAALRRHLTRGVELGLPERALISQRRPWYKMERRVPPPFLFAYLGRRNARFIRNEAGAWPLTGFLCVYSRREDACGIEAVWSLLRGPEVLAGLEGVAKSYGAGALKVEPRALERLPLPGALVRRLGLSELAAGRCVAKAT